MTTSSPSPLQARTYSPTYSLGVRVSLALLWLLSGLQLLNMFAHPFMGAKFEGKDYPNHWDFRVYRAAHEVYREGGNPLDLDALKRHGADVQYNYSPAFSKATMWTFDGDPAGLEFRFVAAKIVAILLAFGVLAWGLRLRGALLPVTAFLLTFGFGSALLVDMAAGNITAFELLWTSLVVVGAFRRWNAMFLIGVFLLCLGKPIWGIFAAVPLAFYWDRRALVAFVLGCAAFALPLVLSVLVSGAETREYLGAAFGFRESGYINPCLREFIGSIGSVVHHGGKSVLLVWLAMVVATMILAVRERVRLSQIGSSAGLAFGAALFLLLPVVLPRYKPYAFVLLVPFLIVALISSRRSPRETMWILLAVAFPFIVIMNTRVIFALVVAGDMILLGIHSQTVVRVMRLVGYFPLATTLVTFWLLSRRTRRGGTILATTGSRVEPS